MTDAEAAREAWEKAWLQSQSLHMYSVVEKAREYISALEAENERLRCCGNCEHRDEEVRDYYGSYFVCLTEFKPKTNLRHIEVDCEDQCRFTPSRWSRREG